MKEKLIVSIIIPIYNVAEYLEQCVESALNQTYEDVEIILVDDGSTDGSGEICDKYMIFSNVCVIHQKNAGLSAARNAGLDVSKGDYVYFLDSDDYIHTDCIRMLVREVQEFGADVVYFDSFCIRENGEMTDNESLIRKQSYLYPKVGSDSLLELQENQDYYTCVPMIFLKRSIASEIRFEVGLLHEDVLFTFLVYLRAQRVIHLPVPLYYRRIRDNSIMTTRVGTRNIESIILIIEKLLRLKAKNNIEERALANQLVVLYEDLIYKYHCLKFSDRKLCNQKIKEIQNKIEKVTTPKSKLYYWVKWYAYKYLGTSLCSKITTKIYYNRVKKQYDLKDIKNHSEKKILLIGTPTHGNLGDHLIALSEIELIKKYTNYSLVEVPMEMYRTHRSDIKRMVSEDDVICISGGGWIGSKWIDDEVAIRNIISDFYNNRIIIFPQTTYYDEDEFGRKTLKNSKKIFSRAKKITVCLRDMWSYDFSYEKKLFGSDAEYVYSPDVALMYNKKTMLVDKKNEVLFCFRRDKERNLQFEVIQNLREYVWGLGYKTVDTTTVYLHGINSLNRDEEVEQKMSEYSAARLVVTDRLHSMIIAALVGTPCVAFDNTTHKVKGVYEWIKNLEYISVVENKAQAEIAVKNYLDNIDQTYNYTLDEKDKDIIVNLLRRI